MVTYVTNLVALIGFALAVDYSLLIVFRFREELARAGAPRRRRRAHDGDGGTGRRRLRPRRGPGSWPADLHAGAAHPLAGCRRPADTPRVDRRRAHAAARASVLARRSRRTPLSGASAKRRTWSRAPGHALARVVMGRPIVFLTAGTAAPGRRSAAGARARADSGLDLGHPAVSRVGARLRAAPREHRAGGITPVYVVVDTGVPEGTREPQVRRAVDRLSDLAFRDRETKVVASGSDDPYVDPTGRYARLVVAGRHEFGTEADAALRRAAARRSRAASALSRDDGTSSSGARRRRASTSSTAPTAPSRGSSRGLLALTYVILLRAFRSLLLPLKAVLLNLLSVAAAYGLLVVIFRWDVGTGLFGLHHADEIEGWIPIFLFAASSASRWTTRSSSSRGCGRRGTRCPTTRAPSRTDSSGPVAS